MEAIVPDSTGPANVGAVLCAERERQGLSRADIAQRLHMSMRQVEALEAGDYERLPKGTFLRGFVRNYARTLGLAPDSVLSLLAEAAPAGHAPDIVVPSQNIRFDPLGERLANPYVKAAALSVVVIAIAFAAMYWWLFIRPTPPAALAHKAATQPASPTVANGNPPAQVAAVAPDLSPASGEASKAAPAMNAPSAIGKPEAARTEPAKNETGKARAEQGVIRFRFKGESWVEIKDAHGKVLFSKLNPAGSEAEVKGEPPLRVVVGNAPEVEMYYNDEEFPLEPHTNVAVARFTVD